MFGDIVTTAVTLSPLIFGDFVTTAVTLAPPRTLSPPIIGDIVTTAMTLSWNKYVPKVNRHSESV